MDIFFHVELGLILIKWLVYTIAPDLTLYKGETNF